MKRNPLSLVLTLAVLTTPAAFGMRYATVTATPILNIPSLLHPPVNNFSGCASDSNTIAVGYDLYAGGFRMLCADAGRIGFWTTPVAAVVVGMSGQDPQPVQRFLCPSGTALAGLQYVEGLLFPFPLCGELIPDFTTGSVQRKVLFSADDTVVEKLSKGPPENPGVVSCGPAGYVQTLQASRNPAGNVTGFGPICNTILTDPANIEDVSVDLAVKTVNQTAVLGRNATQLFNVDVFNLGTAAVPASNISLELRFNGSAWQVLPFNMACTAILAHSGVIDRIVVGERCTIPGTVNGRGGAVSVSFLLEPLGPDTTRPATPTPQAILSVKAGIIDEHLEGADANANNDRAAFPVVLR
jgi:hypothetical protein